MIEKYSKIVIVCPLMSAIPHNERFCSEISSTFRFHARELNIVSECKQLNKLFFVKS